MTDEKEYMDKRWVALALLCMAQFVVILDASIVNVALPTIGEDLTFDQDNLSWVVNSYVLTFGGFLLLGGRLADLLGRRRVFIAGLLLFALASLVGGFAESEGVLIAARAVQGLGAALLSPAALSIVTTTFKDGSERNKALGVWGAVAGSGGAAGVLLGGVLTEYVGWEWVLWVNVPIGIGAALLAPRLLLESHSDAENRTFDFPGAVTVTSGLALLVYALVEAPDAGWGSPETLGMIAGALALLGAFVAIELRSPAPLVPFSIFRIRTLTGANVVGLLTGASLFSMFFFISLYMQNVLGLLRDQGGPLVPAARHLDHPRGRGRVAAGDQGRVQAGDGYRHGVRRRRARVVQPDLGRRQLSGRRPVPVAPCGSRAGLLVRAGDDRGDERREGPRSRPRQRPHQHLAAGRRRAWPRDPLVDRLLDDRRPRGAGRNRAGGTHRGIRGRVHGRRRNRAPGRDRQRSP